MARYIEKTGLADALRGRDWNAFARGYNGPQYRKAGYHTKLKAAYARWRHLDGLAGSGATTLRKGGQGEAVRDLQLALTAVGYPLQADGSFGPATAAALRRFQKDVGLAVDGIYGPATQAKLEALVGRESDLWSRIRRLLFGWLSAAYWTGTEPSAKRAGDEWNPT